MSGRRCGSPDIQLSYYWRMIFSENRCPLFRIMRAYSITCTMRRERGSTSTVEPLITV
jgi:hypothetical protein